MNYIIEAFKAMYTPDVKEAFKIMGQGMLGIFAVMVIIALVVLIFTKFSKKKN